MAVPFLCEAKTIRKTNVKGFGQAFSKACGVKGRSPSRASQRAKLPLRRFSFVSFSLCASFLQREKRSDELGCAYGYIRPVLSHFSFDTIGAKEKLSKENAGFISPSAEGDQGSAFGNRKLLKKLDPNFYSSMLVLC